MKRIVCYGDSNTFGYCPADGSRYDENVRWTSLLQKNLGSEYKVINEGMCDRTGFVSNPKGYMFSAPTHFPNLIKNSKEIDYLILWIGTNDLQFQYNIDIETAEKGLEYLIKTAKTKAKKIIIIPSIILNEKILEGYFVCQFDKVSIIKSKEILKIYKKLARMYDLEFFDVNEYVKPSDIDGLHYDENSHKILANKLAQLFLSI